MPSPEELRERCLEVQARWSESTRRQRTVWTGVVKAEIPFVHVVEVHDD